jgi:hypothetical protein
MTDTPQSLAGTVEIHEQSAYTVMTYVLQNPDTRPIVVNLQQSMPSGVTNSHVTFTSEYHGDAWSLSDATLEFQKRLDPGETVRTAYATEGIALSTLEERIRDSTITLYDEDGAKFATLGGLEPTIAATADEEYPEPTGVGGGAEPAEEVSEGAGDPGSFPATRRKLHEQQEGDDAEDSDDEDEESTDVPARRSDFILSDVRGEIESEAEFEWSDDDDDEEETEPTGILGRIKSWLS